MQDATLEIEPPFHIPESTVARWLAIDATKPLSIPITRNDIDHLFFAIDSIAIAQADLQKALIDYSNGKLDDANESSARAARKIQQSKNRLRVFMNAMMVSAGVIT